MGMSQETNRLLHFPRLQKAPDMGRRDPYPLQQLVFHNAAGQSPLPAICRQLFRRSLAPVSESKVPAANKPHCAALQQRLKKGFPGSFPVTRFWGSSSPLCTPPSLVQSVAAPTSQQRAPSVPSAAWVFSEWPWPALHKAAQSTSPCPKIGRIPTHRCWPFLSPLALASPRPATWPQTSLCFCS